MGYTLASQPPGLDPKIQRRSHWAEILDECRAHPEEWRRIVKPLKRTTAAQIASDIRNARGKKSRRIKALRPDETWEAVWGRDPQDEEPDHYFIWLRFIPEDSTER